MWKKKKRGRNWPKTKTRRKNNKNDRNKRKANKRDLNTEKVKSLSNITHCPRGSNLGGVVEQGSVILIKR